MARRTGSADLPLHDGRVPPRLASGTASLGAVICQAIAHHYCRDELLRRQSHPFWFHSFGAVMGMDWHSSGITTSVIGAPHNPAAAQRVEDVIRITCEGLGDFPYAAAATDEPNVRRVPLVRFPYTVFYRVDSIRDVVKIARVVHGARVRDLDKIPDDI
jgi:plasmid stabilization system protein ParE